MAQTGDRIKSSWLRDDNAPLQKQESGVAARVVMVVALTFTLVAAMRWAINITNANARHISDNINQIQSHISAPSSDYPALQQRKTTSESKPESQVKIPGPSIDPVGTPAN